MGIVEDRLDHCGVAPIALLRACEIDHVDSEYAFRGCATFRRQQCREDWIAIGSRQAHPDDAAEVVDQRRNLAVADHGQFEIRANRAHCGGAPASASSSRKTRTSRGPETRSIALNTITHCDRQPADTLHLLERLFVGHIVPDENGPSSLERRLAQELANRIRLVRALQPQFDDHPALEQHESPTERAKDRAHLAMDLAFQVRNLAVMQRHGHALVFQDRARQAIGELLQPVSRLRDGGDIETVLAMPAPLRVPALEPVHARGRPSMRTEEPIDIHDRATADQCNRPTEDGAKTVEQILQARLDLN